MGRWERVHAHTAPLGIRRDDERCARFNITAIGRLGGVGGVNARLARFFALYVRLARV